MSCELLCEWQPAPALPALSWLACEAGPWGASSRVPGRLLARGGLTNRVIVGLCRAHCCLGPWGRVCVCVCEALGLW